MLQINNKNRIEKMFEACASKNKKAFIGYLTAGDPSVEHTETFIYALERGGTDMIEIGIPFSDPLADGPTIQDAGKRALDGGITVKKILDMTKRVREHTDIPLVYMVYMNTILVYGVSRFIEACAMVGVDGIIVPDLPYEERDELKPMMDHHGLALIPLVAPTSEDRVKMIVEDCHGFVYCVSSLGVTGEKSLEYEDILPYLQHIKKHAQLPIAVGFGISSREDVVALGGEVDGVIVGSAIMKKVKELNGDSDALEAYIKTLTA